MTFWQNKKDSCSVICYRAADKVRISISKLPKSWPYSMFDHLLESSHWGDSNKWSNIEFGQETEELVLIEINFTRLIWNSVVRKCSVALTLSLLGVNFEDQWWPMQTIWIQMKPHKMWGFIWDPNCLTFRLYIYISAKKMGGINEVFENFERNKYLKKLPSMQRVK